MTSGVRRSNRCPASALAREAPKSVERRNVKRSKAAAAAICRAAKVTALLASAQARRGRSSTPPSFSAKTETGKTKPSPVQRERRLQKSRTALSTDVSRMGRLLRIAFSWREMTRVAPSFFLEINVRNFQTHGKANTDRDHEHSWCRSMIRAQSLPLWGPPCLPADTIVLHACP